MLQFTKYVDFLEEGLCNVVIALDGDLLDGYHSGFLLLLVGHESNVDNPTRALEMIVNYKITYPMGLE